MNEILEKAKRDYPIGTKFKSMYVNSENVVTKPIFIQHESIYTTDDNFKWITIYDKSDNKWAEIIKEESTLLEKARRDYPIGTKIKSVYKDAAYIVSKPIFIRYENIYTFDEKGDIRCIYDTALNQWAEIIKEETMFKKGDYIVTLINDGDCGKVNYCSKQNEDSQELCPEIDTKGIKDNGNGRFTFFDKSGLKWRFGTKEEGEEYERQGKPYNVTTFKNTNTMTQQEFNSLRVGETLGEWEILHKYKELLIIEDKRGYDLVDLAKINKLGLKVTPKTFMGLEIKEYDNVPCEMDGCLLVYLTEVKDNCIFYKPSRNFKPNQFLPTSIRIL